MDKKTLAQEVAEKVTGEWGNYKIFLELFANSHENLKINLNKRLTSGGGVIL